MRLSIRHACRQADAKNRVIIFIIVIIVVVLLSGRREEELTDIPRVK